jgi:hypothetical protein
MTQSHALREIDIGEGEVDHEFACKASIASFAVTAS